MDNKPLVSFAILSYKNYHYIKEALQSVFIQTYPNIQLIISNDGSDDFDELNLISYLNENKPDNITQVIINNNERNVGTVKNVNIALSKAKGEYFMLMAADDALYDENVLSRFVEEFERLGPDAYIVSAKTAMCGKELSDVKSYEPDAEGIEAIKIFSPQQMFSRLSHTFTIPTTSTCYRLSLFDKIGKYDEDYFIIEDAPLYIKMARLGYKFHWIDDMVAARHRDGGISHGNTNNLSESFRKYRHDEVIFFEKEVLPYKDQLLPVDLKKMQSKCDYINRVYFDTYIYPNMSKAERRKYLLKNLPRMIWQVFGRAKAKLIELSYDGTLTLEIRNVAIVSMILYVLLLLGVFNSVLGTILKDTLKYIFGIAALVAVALIILQGLMRLIYHFYLTIKYVVTGR